jgi:hypothetical protein
MTVFGISRNEENVSQRREVVDGRHSALDVGKPHGQGERKQGGLH